MLQILGTLALPGTSHRTTHTQRPARRAAPRRATSGRRVTVHTDAGLAAGPERPEARSPTRPTR